MNLVVNSRRLQNPGLRTPVLRHNAVSLTCLRGRKQHFACTANNTRNQVENPNADKRQHYHTRGGGRTFPVENFIYINSSFSTSATGVVVDESENHVDNAENCRLVKVMDTTWGLLYQQVNYNIHPNQCMRVDNTNLNHSRLVGESPEKNADKQNISM